MNERIQELMVELKKTVSTHRGDAVLIGYDEIEKFAELIVRECAKVIINGGYWSGGPVGPKRQCTPPEIAEMVKDVFGVKE